MIPKPWLSTASPGWHQDLDASHHGHDAHFRHSGRHSDLPEVQSGTTHDSDGVKVPGRSPHALPLRDAHDRDLEATLAHRRCRGARYGRDLLLRVVRGPGKN
ncbi:MAG: hypothetical protein V3U67_04150, partial [Gemmatimonadota bacterium]